MATGEVTVTDAHGIAPSATRDGSLIAVADAGSGLVVIADAASWLGGGKLDAPGIAAPTDAAVQDLAIDADGTRLAIVYSAVSGVASTVVILRLNGSVWETFMSLPIRDDAAVSIDWLD